MKVEVYGNRTMVEKYKRLIEDALKDVPISRAYIHLKNIIPGEKKVCEYGTIEQ